MSGLTLVTGPAAEPLTLDEIKDHLRVTDDAEDAYIDSLIAVARRTYEHDTGQKLITQTWDYVLDAFPAGDTIDLPYPPLQSVTSIKYNDVDSAEQTLSSANYTVDTDSLKGRVVLKSNQSWPSTDDEIQAVTVRFICGYGADYSSVPEDHRHAIRFLVMHLFDMREPVVWGMTVANVPLSYRTLVSNNKVHYF